MLISIHAILNTKFAHTEELALLKSNRDYHFSPTEIDVAVNRSERQATANLVYGINADPEQELMDIMPIALDPNDGHGIMLFDIYDLNVQNVETFKQLFQKYASSLCDNTNFQFVEKPRSNEFQLEIKQL